MTLTQLKGLLIPLNTWQVASVRGYSIIIIKLIVLELLGKLPMDCFFSFIVKYLFLCRSCFSLLVTLVLADFSVCVDILVPLDNYISRSTAHFLTCKEPDYQQSLWKMISSVSYFTFIKTKP